MAPVPMAHVSTALAEAATRVLDGFRADAVLARQVRLARDWRFAVDTCSVPRLYFVARGAVRLERPGAPAVWATVGDTLFLPRGGDHVLGTAARGPRLALSSVVTVLRADAERVLEVGRGTGEPSAAAPEAGSADLVACLIEPASMTGAWLHALPPFLHVRAGGSAGAAEIAALIPRLGAVPGVWQGGRTVARRRLAETWVALAVGAALAEQGTLAWLLLADERLAPVVAAVLADPAAPWTLAAMARTAGLSRAAFAARFRRAAGEPPHRFVRGARVAAAAAALRTGASAARAAALAGYSGESALRRAAHRATGRPLRELTATLPALPASAD
jgi:AraC-like DNA-binding protein